MTSLDQQCISTSAIVAQSVLDHSHWRAFGYRRRPRRGKIFRILVPAKRIERETVLLQEFWAASFARVYCWALERKDFRYRVEFIARLLDICIDGLDEALWSTLRFPTARDATNYLLSACQDYGNHDHSEHPRIFVNRCISHLNQRLPRRWLAGAAWLFTSSNSLITAIIPALNASRTAENPQSDLSVRKEEYLTSAHKLYTS